jgi:hypothetical protein
MREKTMPSVRIRRMLDPGHKYGSQAYVMKPEEGGLMHCAPNKKAAKGPIAFTRPVASRTKVALDAKNPQL